MSTDQGKCNRPFSVEGRGGNQTMSDDINSPAHYTKGGIECIDYLRAKMSHEEFVGFVRGNAIKYLTRMMDKNDAFEDAKKSGVVLL